MRRFHPSNGLPIRELDPGFGVALRAVRESRRLNQSQAAKLLECDHSYISRLEVGQREPSREFVERVVHLLSLGADEADRLRVAGGFTPRDLPDLDAYPEVRELLALLAEPALSHGVRSTIRATVDNVNALGRRLAAYAEEARQAEDSEAGFKAA